MAMSIWKSGRSRQLKKAVHLKQSEMPAPIVGSCVFKLQSPQPFTASTLLSALLEPGNEPELDNPVRGLVQPPHRCR